MLLEDFYHIAQLQSSGNKLAAHVLLNPRHEVYKGHFPEQAVVPGVVQLQMIKELFEQAVSRELLISEIIQAKYLRMITPAESTLLDIQVEWSQGEEGTFLINASVSGNQTVFTKLKARLKEAETNS